MNKRTAALVRLVARNKTYYLGAIGCTLITVLIGFVTPLVFSETIDTVLSDGVSTMPAFVQNAVAAIGGRAYLREHLIVVGALLVGLSVINGVFSYFKGRMTAVAGENVARTLRDNLYSHLAHLPYSFHVQAATGDLIQRCTSDVDTVRRFLSTQLVEIFNTVLMVVLALVILVRRSPMLTLYSMLLVPFLLCSATVFFRSITRSFKASDESEGQMSAVLQENLTGVRVVRAFGRQQGEVEKFDRASRDFRDKSYVLLRQLSTYWGSSDALTILQIMITLIVCVVFAVRGDISVGTLIVFTSYISQLLYPIRGLGRILSDMGKSLVALDRIEDILQRPRESDPADALTPPLDRDIVFDHVSFAYGEGQEVLHDVSFTIPAGKTFAILGATGSGKSTLVHLLQRLVEPSGGTITIGGVDIQKIERKYLRAHVGLILQEPFLYSKTLYENLRIACPAAGRADVDAAAHTASVDSFLREFEKGYDTVVGERGVTLSGGQKQRVAIARTLLKPNDVLIFDDSLSAVDTHTDQMIRDALRTREGSLTTIIISHRITTLSQADQILVLEDGRIAAQGTHAELLAQGGLYQRINHIQNELEEELRSADDAVQSAGA